MLLGQTAGTARAQTSPVTPASTERYLWKPVAIGGGGFITGYDADRSGATRVIRTDVYGAYLWIADGARWAQLVTASTMPESDRVQNGAADGVYEIAVAPSKAERIYMAIKGHVYRSDDRGTSFVRASHAKPFPMKFDPNSEFRHYGSFMAVSPVDPDLVFLGTPEDGLLRSQDAGVTWQSVAGMPKGQDLRPAAGVQSPGVLPWFERVAGSRYSGRILAMSAGNGLFVSSDAGRSFAPLVAADRPQPKTLKHGAFAPDGTFYGVDIESGTLWRLRDASWTNLTEHRGLTTGRFASVAINPRNGQIFVFEENGRAFRSGDGGERWVRLSHRSRVGEGDPPWLRVANQSYFATSRVVFDPVLPDRMINSAGTGVYVADMPETAQEIVWTSQTRGVEELVANDAVHPPGRAPLFASWDFGIHLKTDLDAFSTTYGPKERVLIAAQQVDWSASDPNFLVTNASDTRMDCCSQDGQSVLAGYSLDAGRSWTRFPSLPQPPGTQASDPWRMSFGSIAVSSDDTKNIIWLPSFDRSPFYTMDRGASWTRVQLPGETLPNTGSHAQYYYVRRTLTADRVSPGVFYYFHSGEGRNVALRGLWRTQDGGGSWARIYDREIAPHSGFSAKLRAVPGKEGHLFFTSGVAEGQDLRLRRSIDGGASWTQLPNVDHVDDIGFGKAAEGSTYPTIFLSGRVSGGYGIWRSTDDASSWKQVAGFPLGTLDQVSVVEADKDRFGRVYVGYKGSGWRYGEPATCNAAPYRFPNASECTDVR
ncbi:hypothetical protein [Bosea sp. PAMC 26642]|uniref:hypothetical protein n=1 Tax=Bosea sp. (strain PAMC 26642) TaxID=1792307 RepID=UPI0007703B14|nr:hypothetical protein [Bosea sp. PAMC 26642]AMJ63794.1 hypothetical protein AXW83_18510 [Bosea sp. PAMC 26642]